jgi:hypothetical protein
MHPHESAERKMRVPGDGQGERESGNPQNGRENQKRLPAAGGGGDSTPIWPP